MQPTSQLLNENCLRNSDFLSQRLKLLAALALLLLATCAVYLPSLNGPFQLDDPVNIKPISLDELSLRELQDKVLSGRFGGLSRSLGKVSLALTEFRSGYQPRPFKTQNLLLHIANGLLVFWLTALVIQLARKSRQIDPDVWWIALLVTAIWLLHPIQVSTVAYAVQRLVLLSAFFSLLAAILYTKGRRIINIRPFLGLALIIVGLAGVWPFGLLSKENAFLLAPALLLVESLFFHFKTDAGLPRTLLWTLITVFLVVPIIAALSYLSFNHEQLLLGYQGRSFSMIERLFSEIHAIWLYLKLIFFPLPGSMHLFNDNFPVQRTLDFTTLAGGLGVVSLLGVAIHVRKTLPLIAFAVLWFFVWHALESTVLPLELVFEHRNYLALLGPAIVIALSLQALRDRHTLRRFAPFAVAAALALLGANTLARSVTWSSLDRFAGHEYQSSPNSPRAINTMLLFALERKDYDAASYFLKRLQVRLDDEAWPLLSELLLRCRDSETPTRLVEETLIRLDEDRLRPADIERLRALAKRVHGDECPALPSSQLTDLLRTAAENNRVHAMHTRLGALNLYVRDAGANREFEAAKDTARAALAIAVNGSPVWLRSTMQAAADAAAHLDSYDAALAFLSDISRGYEATLERKNVEIKLLLAKDGKEIF